MHSHHRLGQEHSHRRPELEHSEVLGVQPGNDALEHGVLVGSDAREPVHNVGLVHSVEPEHSDELVHSVGRELVGTPELRCSKSALEHSCHKWQLVLGHNRHSMKRPVLGHNRHSLRRPVREHSYHRSKRERQHSCHRLRRVRCSMLRQVLHTQAGSS